MLLLARSDGFGGGAVAGASAGFDFYEDDGVVLLGDDVDFAGGAGAVVDLADGIAGSVEVLEGESLAKLAENTAVGACWLGVRGRVRQASASASEGVLRRAQDERWHESSLGRVSVA